MNRLTELDRNSNQAVVYMIREITHICRDMKKRSPGSEGEREAGDYMADILRKNCGCKDVKVEPFTTHPAAFYSYFYFLFQFVLYKQLIDPFFPERVSINVTALRPCTGLVKRRVFLNGHIDAAWEFPLNYHFGGVVFEIPGVVAVIGVLFYMALGVCTLRGAGAWTHTAALWGLLFVPFFLLVGSTYNPKRVVDGANDNLTGCYMGITVLREMERLGISLENTEVGVILTGSEEAGLRGAKAWCKAHADDYRDVPTCIICFDTIHDPQKLMVNLKDLNGTVSSDPELAELFLRAAEEAGVPCFRGLVPLMGGGTDSAAFTQGGFRSIGVTGLSHKLEDYYHTRRDSYDNLDETGLENCYRAVIRLLDMMDSLPSDR